MKYIIFSGTTGSGKDTIINRLHEDLKNLQIEPVKRAWYYTTRKVDRKGENPNRKDKISDEEFNEKVSKGEIILDHKNSNYQVGYPSEILNEKSGIIIFNIAVWAAKQLQDYALQNDGRAVTIFLDAPKEQRIGRIKHRDGLSADESVIFKVENDITKSEHATGYNLVVQNKDGDLEKNYEIILSKVKEFLNA
ncbi:MAG: AAA family ATPase [Candidatus Doudnabacteria bacterium]|nr:AAA family ATPase [Candidatus Doudnabacteria bacterium]